MKFSSITFIVTDDCNFNCAYCLQKKEKKYMNLSTIEKAVSFFYPFLEAEAYIPFYGGEPLLNFEIIKNTVSLFQEKNREENRKLYFSLTTNGSMVTDEMLDFFDLHGFLFMLSFDGRAQDVARKPGTLAPTLELVRRLQGETYPGIDFRINSVFTPKTVKHLCESMRDIIDGGGTEIQLSLDVSHSWDEAALLSLEKELERLTDFLVSYYREKGSIPVSNFRGSNSRASPKRKQTFFCKAGRDRLAITPEENLWGCFQFHDYLKDKKESSDFRTYSIGQLDDFIKNHETIYPKVLVNYAFLRQDCFFTGDRFCFLCRDMEHCGFCPVYAAYSTSLIGKLPSWMCGIIKIEREKKRKLLEEINGLKPQP